jgi:hypothetical protein
LVMTYLLFCVFLLLFLYMSIVNWFSDWDYIRECAGKSRWSTTCFGRFEEKSGIYIIWFDHFKGLKKSEIEKWMNLWMCEVSLTLYTFSFFSQIRLNLKCINRFMIFLMMNSKKLRFESEYDSFVCLMFVIIWCLIVMMFEIHWVICCEC